MKANKHQINGYIYITTDEKVSINDLVLNILTNNFYTCYCLDDLSIYDKKIIICNDIKLPIQQLTKDEFEYLKNINTFKVDKEAIKWYNFPKSYRYKIITQQKNEKLTPIQELIEFMTNGIDYDKQDILCKAVELLPKEQQVIEDACNAGLSGIPRSAKNYYNTKFKNNEK